MTASFQERVFTRILQSVLPTEDDDDRSLDPSPPTTQRPAFSLTTMSQNFRRFNSRIGIVFLFQHQVLRLLSWKTPSHTLSAGLVYSFICLDPYLVFSLPPAISLLFLMVPSFITRHPPAPNTVYTASGPAIAPAPEVRAVSEISKDFFSNLRDLQNTMDDFTTLHDYTIALIGPPTNFSDEKLSSAVFLALFFASIVMFVSAHLLPWRLIFLLMGWLGLALTHPMVQKTVLQIHEAQLKPHEKLAAEVADSWIHRDITLSTTPETREVEIFQLQRRTSSGEYEPWIFSPNPYEPLSPARISTERPKGARFFEDVRSPPGWEWCDGKWALDLSSVTWVAERCIVEVKVEEDGERWVYDYECGERGDWRRRRWVRGVKRKYIHD